MMYCALLLVIILATFKTDLYAQQGTHHDSPVVNTPQFVLSPRSLPSSPRERTSPVTPIHDIQALLIEVPLNSPAVQPAKNTSMPKSANKQTSWSCKGSCNVQ